MSGFMALRQASRITIAALLVSIAACSDSSGPEPITGTYTLRTVNGTALPYLAASETSGGVTTRVEVTAGNVVLNADLSFTSSITLRQTVGSTVTTTASTTVGTYTIAGSQITFRSSDGVATPATLAGGTITGVSLGLTLVFSK